MAEVYMNSKFLLKRGIAEKWAELNPILEEGEPGFIIDEQRLRVGDGITHFNDLPYIGGNATDEDIAILLTNQGYIVLIGTNDGVIYADNNGKLYIL